MPHDVKDVATGGCMIIECRAARCEEPSGDGEKLCSGHAHQVDSGVTLQMKQGRPRVLAQVQEAEDGSPEVQEAGVPKVGHDRTEAGRSGGDVLLQDVQADVRVFPDPPQARRKRNGRKPKARAGRKNAKARKPQDLHLTEKSISRIVKQDPDPEIYAGKLLIPLIQAIDWEEVPIDEVEKLLIALSDASNKGSPVYRRRLAKAQVSNYKCGYCDARIDDGKWVNMSIVRDATGGDIQVPFDSHRCYLMYFQGDGARTRAAQAR